MTKMLRSAAAALALLLAPAALLRAGEAHRHGVARLDVAVDGTRVSLALDTPLDNLLGFEHAPRNAAERRAADAAVATLRQAAALFRFDIAAGCRSTAVGLRCAMRRRRMPISRRATSSPANAPRCSSSTPCSMPSRACSSSRCRP